MDAPGGPTAYGDLGRPPLQAGAPARALEAQGWRIEVVARAGSTNALVSQRAREGEAAGLVLVAEEQTAGRGRLDRSWTSPPRAGLTFSLLLRPDLPAALWPWLPLWAGVGVARALREHAGVDAVLKWPNDVLVGGRKVAGLLAEVPEAGAVVLGVGLNVTTRREELPYAAATSLVLEGAVTTDRDTLLRAVLRAVAEVMGAPTAAPEAYRALCSSLGTPVRVELPGGGSVTGAAVAVDDRGRLVVDGPDGRRAYGAGDVVHLRPG